MNTHKPRTAIDVGTRQLRCLTCSVQFEAPVFNGSAKVSFYRTLYTNMDAHKKASPECENARLEEVA